MKKITITTILKSDIEKVWNIVTNNQYFKWRSDISKIEILDNNNFIEISKNGYRTQFEITIKEPLKYYAFKIKGPNINGKWHGTFSKYQSGTQIKFIEEITPKNPIMYLLLGFYLKKQQNIYISDLRKALGE